MDRAGAHRLAEMAEVRLASLDGKKAKAEQLRLKKAAKKAMLLAAMGGKVTKEKHMRTASPSPPYHVSC